MSQNKTAPPDSEKNIKEANRCIGIGVGVGALGTAAAVGVGAVCPICFIVSPAIITVGLVARLRAKKRINEDKKK